VRVLIELPHQLERRQLDRVAHPELEFKGEGRSDDAVVVVCAGLSAPHKVELACVERAAAHLMHVQSLSAHFRDLLAAI